jgi:hypothetical protein
MIEEINGDIFLEKSLLRKYRLKINIKKIHFQILRLAVT